MITKWQLFFWNTQDISNDINCFEKPGTIKTHIFRCHLLTNSVALKLYDQKYEYVPVQK